MNNIITGIIDRRILANFRVDPDTLANFLPKPFRPKVVSGYGIAGICLIRLKQIRPKFFPSFLGMGSENAAYRIAVEWEQNGIVQEGVYIPRRDTSSKFNTLVGGCVFPGVHQLADFKISEEGKLYQVEITSKDEITYMAIEAEIAEDLPRDSIFNSVEEVSNFFENGSVGYSPLGRDGEFEGLELKSFNWQVTPLKVSHIKSSFFEDPQIFPEGTIAFDNALLMRGIDHEWHSRDLLCCSKAND